MIRVLIVDDHPVVRSGLQALLEGAPDLAVVGTAASGEEALRLTGQVDPDVVLCDLRLGPGLDGVGVTTALRAHTGGPAVLILTTYDNDSDITRAVLAGAAGYLLKDAQPAEIIAGIADAAAGRLVLSTELEGRVVERMTQGVPSLSARELDVLRLVAEGVTNRGIAKRLYISEGTVKTHLVHAFAKLGAESRTAAVAAARRHGLLE
ncbi:DNA-binding response regulator [Tessaracoccus lapidicaptus]|uniref:DNA-binding response regulator n=1 Tax=Tessaracoccus lapidicaptus TaxID=1427523 RepID=A0A1C0AQ47_9ACTN|nr:MULTISPECIES: response regulator transcription factor [Tessaracoccus]AQX15177.1 DNA-binding response regulator [Tessaracoccus sp. T2.5-30]OCL36511.1 DNA-binding response regulator [Tessaracoccus lapidicaptus]VEP39403.1 Transcriptional regulatory protein LiaR [Tessaracoccus lapidicaptus]